MLHMFKERNIYLVCSCNYSRKGTGGLSTLVSKFQLCQGVPVTIKARSNDPFLRIRFLVPKTGSRRSDGPISRFRFCGENVGRSFVVCSHDPFSEVTKNLQIWRQNVHAKFVGAFHPSRRLSDENRACSISIRFFF